MNSDAIFTQHHQMVYKIAYAKMRNENDASDIMQEVFLKYIENQDNFESEEHIKWWLIKVTVNACKKFAESSWNKKAIYLTDELTSVFENKTEQFLTYDKYDVENEISETIRTIPEKYQNVLNLYYFADKSVREISVMIGITEGAVKTQLRRGKQLLKDCLYSKHYIANRMVTSLKSDLFKYFEHMRERYGRGNVKISLDNRKFAILNIDFANGWTQKGCAFSCDADFAVEAAFEICQAARNSREEIPVLFSRTVFGRHNNNNKEIWKDKMPVKRITRKYEYLIDSRMQMQKNEFVFDKNGLSCFQNSNLDQNLKLMNIDTLIITGLTAGGAVRHTVMDAMSLGYKVYVVKEAVADRIEGAVLWNLFDLEMLYGCVVSKEDIMGEINTDDKIERQKIG